MNIQTIIRRARYYVIGRQIRDLQQSIHQASIRLGKRVQEQQELERKLTEAERYQIEANADHWTSLDPF
jgi:hypothetical protein